MNKCGLFQKTAGDLRWWQQQCNPRKTCNFYPHLRLQKVFPALNLPQNCYIMTLGCPYPAYIPCLKDNPYNLTKCKGKISKGKIPISQLSSELGKSWKYSKISIFNLFHELGQINNSCWSNIQKSLCELGKT